MHNSFQSCVWESAEPNKLAHVFKQILRTRYLMAPGSGTGLHMDLLLTGCPCVPVSLYVTECTSDCMCVCVCLRCVHVRVKSWADINLATVLCPGALDTEVFEGVLFQQIKQVYNYSSQAVEDTRHYYTVYVCVHKQISLLCFSGTSTVAL